MQQSSMVQFCDECGLANDLQASHCSACHHPLAHVPNSASVSAPIAPITITPPPVREVTPGSLFSTTSQHALVESLLPYGSPNPSGDFLPGTLLARRYKIEEEIGRGGFSVVYRAVDLNSRHREVAIKRIQLSALSPRQVIDATETFNRELTMLARFKNMSGIPAFYEHLTDAENWYLIMQYIPGQTLEDFLHDKPGGYLSEEETIAFGLAIAQLMQTLHAANPPVIFRDLKPSNIMLTSQNEFFLIDFGIARNYTPGKARDTTPLGSPGFAPPEQYGRTQTDQRSDIYSLGATMQTLITGRDPQELRAGEPARNQKPPTRAMRKLLDDMLSPNSKERPWTMTRVVTLLEEVQNQGQQWRSYWFGLIITAFIDIYLAIIILSGFQESWISAMVFPFLMLNRSIGKNIRKRLGVRKPSQRYIVFGVLTALIPILILLLWHSFWWSF
ncbi:MAG TPA: serine/threonine-protein kinase [Ktedonobacteraceae bacterium]